MHIGQLIAVTTAPATTTWTQVFWNWFFWVAQQLPWLIIALVAARTLARRKRNSRSLTLQTIGAAGMFVLFFVEKGGMWVLGSIGTGQDFLNTAEVVFAFLVFASLLTFMLGYLGEKWSQPKEATIIPVDAKK